MVGINSLPVFVLLGLSVGRALYPSSNHFVSALLPRQDDFVDDLACGPQCEPGACGTGSCAFDSITPEAFRDFSPQNISEVRPPIFGGHKSGIKSGGGNKTLSRRVFRYGFTSNNYNGKKPTVAEADYYLPQVLLHDRENDYFGNADGFFVTGSEAAVMSQRQFGDEPFQFGTNGLHGCTMVTIVSRRAVWMAHFWEVFSHSGKFGVEPNDITYMGFRERVLDVIRDIPVTNPVNPPGGKVYEPPVGPRIDPNLFNRPDDDTQILLYVPNPMGSEGVEKATQRYAKRNAQMIDALRERVGVDPVVKTFICNALYYDNPADKALSRTTRRGMALFQYDPNSNKKRKRAWRLLYENGFYSGVIE